MDNLHIHFNTEQENIMIQMQMQMLLNKEQANLKLTRLAYEIYENNIEQKMLVLAGISSSGIEISKILKQKIEEISLIEVRLVNIKINKQNPIECQLENDTQLKNKNIILVDDVANSGRTLLYAIKPFLDQVCQKIQVAVLIDRKHKKFPITADFVGLQLASTLQNNIIVEVKNGIVEGAYIK